MLCFPFEWTLKYALLLGTKKLFAIRQMLSINRNSNISKAEYSSQGWIVSKGEDGIISTSSIQEYLSQDNQSIHLVAFREILINLELNNVLNLYKTHLTLVMMRGGTMCPPKVFLFFYQKSLPLTKP